MTNLDRNKLRALAMAATQGEWMQHLVDDTTIVSETGIDIGTTCDSSQTEREDAYNVEYERMEADAAYIAAANPKNMIALLDQIDEAEKAIQICQSIIKNKKQEIAALEARNKRMKEALIGTLCNCKGDEVCPPNNYCPHHGTREALESK